MFENKQDSLKVKYTNVDGMHFFMSGDNPTKGLCVGHSDLKIAFDEVAYQLHYLFEKNHEMDIKLTPEATFDEFAVWVEAASAAQVNSITPVPAASMGWLPEDKKAA